MVPVKAQERQLDDDGWTCSPGISTCGLPMGWIFSVKSMSLDPLQGRCLDIVVFHTFWEEMVSHPQLHTSSQSPHDVLGGGHLCSVSHYLKRQEQHQFLEQLAQYRPTLGFSWTFVTKGFHTSYDWGMQLLIVFSAFRRCTQRVRHRSPSFFLCDSGCVSLMTFSKTSWRLGWASKNVPVRRTTPTMSRTI